MEDMELWLSTIHTSIKIKGLIPYLLSNRRRLLKFSLYGFFAFTITVYFGVSVKSRGTLRRETGNLNIVLVHKTGDDSAIFSHENQIVNFVRQYRLFDPNSIITIITDITYVEHLLRRNMRNVDLAVIDDLRQSEEHSWFKNTSFHAGYSKGMRGGFWNHAMERFFILNDFTIDSGLSNIFLMVCKFVW